MAAKRRRRKRRGAPTPPPVPAPRRPPRRRQPPDERPLPPWGSFPLAELTIVIGMVMLFIGLAGGNVTTTAVGAGLGCLGGLEVAVPEHFAGYRSHTTLLSGAVFVAAVAVFFYFSGLVLAICLAIGAVAFAVSFYYLRRAFQRASGGLSFKVRGFRG